MTYNNQHSDDIFGTNLTLNSSPAFAESKPTPLQSPLTYRDASALNRQNYNLTKDDFYFPGESPYTFTSVPQSSVTQPILSHETHNTPKQKAPSSSSTRKRKLGVYILNAVVGISCLWVFIMTCSQFTNSEKTKQGSSIYVIDDSSKDACDVVPHRPLRFHFQGDPEYLHCAWAPKVSVGRFFLSLFGIFWVIIGYYATAKNKKYILWIFCGLGAVLSLCNFIMMCADASAVNTSNSWCKGGMEGFQLTGTAECNYLPYIITCLADVVTFFAWAGVSIVTFRFIRSVSPA